MRLTLVPALLASAALLAAAAPADVHPLGPAGAPGRLFPAADRPVAPVVTDFWGEERQRDLAGEARQIVDKLGVKPGQTVADIGAGAGYDTLRLARVVGPRGRILAEDIKPEYLAGLKAAVQKQKLRNVELALGLPDDPQLPPRSADLAILIHMYHEISGPYAFLYNLAPAIKPGGRVGVVDAERPTSQHGTPPALLKCEFEAVGYRQISRAPMEGGLGYVAVFAPPAPGDRPAPQAIRTCRQPAGR